MKSTYTYAVLPVSHAAYVEIKTKLTAAGYGDQFHEDREDGVLIDMHGIALKDEGEKSMNQQNAGIGWAVKQLQNGDRVRRAGWNGKGMYLELQVPDANSKMGCPYVYIKGTDELFVPWNASQGDLLAIDWEIAE
jgi:Protein of unknown function (DUF2829)